MTESCKNFKNKRQEAMSLRREGFSYRQISKIMNISTQCIWDHLNAFNVPLFKTRKLTNSEKKKYTKMVGKPRGQLKGRNKEREKMKLDYRKNLTRKRKSK